MSKQLYAVYGSLRCGLGNHRVIEDAKYVGTTQSSPNYTMVSFGSFPALVRKGDTSVVLEVYEVNDPLMKQRLDMLEGYHGKNDPNNFYNKVTISTEFGDAFLYEINEDSPSGDVVESGDWLKYLQEKYK